MRPRNESARDRLQAVLSRLGPMGAGDLAQALDVSVATLHRLLLEQPDLIVSAGRARRTRHAFRRPLRSGAMTDVPLYRVSEQGRIDQVGTLALLRPQGSWLDLSSTGWPVPDESRDG